MTSCLGIFIEPNIIKYAKISKDHDNLRVESFGIKFYDKIGEAINQIISDTYSFKTPISINLSEESYQYFNMFTLLNKADLRKAIQTEFEEFCSEKGINRNTLETRYILVNNIDDKEKIKVIHIATNKTSMINQEQPLAEYRVSTISPISVSISNIANLKQKENVLIVNMENQTTITTITDQKIYQIDKLENGASEALEEIRLKENSYSKAYEICKNSTIYTMEGQELQEETNEYLDNIMPTLYKIATAVKEIVSSSLMKIDKVYLTGTLSVVNNIDLYFQEVLGTEKCEILKPFFIKDSLKVNMKDYIEVNSAIALALQGLEYGIKEVNFKKQTFKDSLSGMFSGMKTEGKGENGKTSGPKVLTNFNMSLKGKFDATERWMLRTIGGILILTVVYIALAMFISNAIDTKNEQIADVKLDTQKKIAEVSADIQNVNAKTNEYQRLSDNLKNISNQVSENSKNKNNIPNLLSEIMYAIPKGVQITAIENTSGKHIIIQAQSEKYEQLGYFKAILRTKGILTPDTITSSPGEKSENLVKATIEGDMP
jgi:hypothetical protein